MEKEELLAIVSRTASEGLVSEEEVREAFRRGKGEIQAPLRKKFSLTTILYGIGGIIVAIGIVLFFQQHWQELSEHARIFVTLGSGILLYAAGILLFRTESVRGVAWAFFLAFSLVTPLGIWVTFDSLHAQFPFFGYETIISFLMLAWFVASYFLIPMQLFTLGAIFAGSIFYFGVTADFLVHNAALDIGAAYEYRFLVLGISYCFLAYAWRTSARLLSPSLNFFGTAMALGAAMALGGYAPSANLFWETIFPGLALGTMFLSIPLKSRAILIVGSLYLMGYIMKITAEYFSDTLGWPIALMLAGFAMIVIGYGTLILGKKSKASTSPDE